jgi:hydrogenase maturation protease
MTMRERCASEDRSTSLANEIAGALLSAAGLPLNLSMGPFASRATARVLVAGVGDVCFGDDGFGVEVAQRLLGRHLPAGVDVVDFGIRGFDLACALGAAESVILVDVYPHGCPPGSLTVIDPNLASPENAIAEGLDAEAPGLDPASVLRLARAMSSLPARLVLVGCQPERLGPVDGQVGLSAPVEAAVAEAVSLVEALAADLVRH